VGIILEMMVPSTDDLSEAFRHLTSLGFAATERIPLVAARQWRPSWERQAFRRFLRRMSNVDEVGLPGFYLAMESHRTRRLYRALTLGRADPELAASDELKPLYQGGQEARPFWTVVHRFGRFVVRSHPSSEGRDWVYFGDDTLFLMRRSRELMALLNGPRNCLDLCCGGGGVGLALPPFQGELLGVDLNGTAIELAQGVARAQGLENYHYRCTDAAEGLTGQFDLIFGNPPTLSPALTGRDVFHATGNENVLPELLEHVLPSLTDRGMALFTFFSQVEGDRDEQWERLGKLLKGRRGFKCYARREYPLGSGKRLRHSALELMPRGTDDAVFEPLDFSGIQLPGVAWRKV
jgi:SAM-dependent methyltransferase